eukprot:6593960-Prymnesium_polylepis.2
MSANIGVVHASNVIDWRMTSAVKGTESKLSAPAFGLSSKYAQKYPSPSSSSHRCPLGSQKMPVSNPSPPPPPPPPPLSTRRLGPPNNRATKSLALLALSAAAVPILESLLSFRASKIDKCPGVSMKPA